MNSWPQLVNLNAMQVSKSVSTGACPEGEEQKTPTTPGKINLLTKVPVKSISNSGSLETTGYDEACSVWWVHLTVWNYFLTLSLPYKMCAVSTQYLYLSNIYIFLVSGLITWSEIFLRSTIWLRNVIVLVLESSDWMRITSNFGLWCD